MDEGAIRFVERMGLLVEEDGWPRIAGRILGFLMVTPDECSLDDIASALGVSRASVSTDARRLSQAGMLERRSRPGDRRDYYRIAPESVRSSLRARIGRLRQYHELIDDAASEGVGGPEVRTRLAGWSEAHGLVLSAMEGALAELDRRADEPPGHGPG
ncbi:MAG: GbsR/MarR family transcriptional regulator [Gemmatimonadaceae bacterium]